MSVLGDDPERIEFLGTGDPERIVAAQLTIRIVDPVIGISGRIDQGGRDVGGKIGISGCDCRHIHRRPSQSVARRQVRSLAEG
jgi:hypothetical protein